MQVWKRFLSCALVGACVLLPVNQFNELTDVFAAEESTEPAVWDGTYDTSWYDSESTEMHISTAEELAGLAQLVNNGHTMAGKTIILGNDIVLNDVSNYENWGTEAPTNTWVAIGNADYNFEGTFDGGNHSIIGLHEVIGIYSISVYPSRFAGLFYKLGESSTVCNVTCNHAYIRAYNSKLYAGGICSYLSGGTISNCNYNGVVYVYENGPFDSYHYVGGIVGYVEMNGKIMHCSSSGTITSKLIADNNYTRNAKVGGICGYVDVGSIINSINNSTVLGQTGNSIDSYSYVGGICGQAEWNGKIANCCNYGSVSASADYIAHVGGVCGQVYYNLSVENCYNRGSISVINSEIDGDTIYPNSCHIGGIVGYSASNKITNMYNTGICINGTNGSDYIGGILGSFSQPESPPAITKSYYLSSSALRGVGRTGIDDTTIAKNQANMQTEAFAETLGDAFVYVEGDYPKLFWELGLALRGDVNTDGLVTVADAILLQQYLLNLQSLDEKQYEGALITEDDSVNGFDLAVLKRMLLSE